MSVAAALRRRGASVEYALKAQALGKQLKAAATVGARRVVILTADRLAEGTATVKTLADGHEESVRLAEWLQQG
jgi:histidyl-tRNA synthetase